MAGGPQSGHIAKLAGVGSGKDLREVALPVEPRYCKLTDAVLINPFD